MQALVFRASGGLGHFGLGRSWTKNFKNHKRLYFIYLKLLTVSSLSQLQLVLSQTQFVGSEFGIFGGFEWVLSLILVDNPGFGRVQSSVFPDLGLGSAHFWPNRFEVQVF